MSDAPWTPPDARGPSPGPGAEPTFGAPHAGTLGAESPWTSAPLPPQRGRGNRGRTPWGLVVALGCVMLVVLLAIGSTLLGSDGGAGTADDESAEPIDVDDPSGHIPEAPPSARGELPTTTVPGPVGGQHPAGERHGGDDGFAELSCRFTGTSTLEQPLSLDSFGTAQPNRMRLEPGARFDCTDGDEAAAGSLELDARFESLSVVAGLGFGTGRITWTELPPARQVAGELAPTSTTGVEVQLELPEIVVWTTILDGPYAGYRGRLVLRDWEPIPAGSGDIVGTRFATTATTFSPG